LQPPPPPPPPPPAQEFAQDCQFATSMALQSSKPPWTSSDHSDIKTNHPERCNNTIGLLADLSLLTDPLILVQVPSC